MSNLQKKVLPAPPSDGFYSPSNQFRSSTDQRATWYQCREEFHRRFNQRKEHTGFYYGTDHIAAVARMFRWVEGRLNLRKDMQTKIYRCEPLKRSRSYSSYDYYGLPSSLRTTTTQHNLVYIELSPFWLSQRTRTYFATIMVRASHEQSGTPLERLMKTWYCRETPRATALFLDGRTDAAVKRHTGWVVRYGVPGYYTRKPTKKRISLKRPTRKVDCKYFNDGDPRSLLTKRERGRIAGWMRNSEQKQGIEQALPKAFQ